MPIVGDNTEALGDFLEELIEKLDELIAARQEVTVNVPAQKPPVVNVPAQEPPVVNVAAPAARWKSVVFTVHRDAKGLIKTVTATPKTATSLGASKT